jgi:hypothetical protein
MDMGVLLRNVGLRWENGQVRAERWIWVSLPHATFGLAVANGRVVDAAPIARWAIGKDESRVAAYFKRRGAQFRALEP